MFVHRCLRALLPVSLGISVVLFMNGCGTPGLTVIAVSPATQTLSSAGESAQFTAVGTYHEGTSKKDITALVAWKSSDVAVATVSAAGKVTAVSPGATTITASLTGVNSSLISGTAVVTVSPFIGPSLATLTVIPGSQTVVTLNETGQFIAVGTFGTAVTSDLTNLVTWISSDVQVATVNSSGLVVGLSNGTTTITAVAKGSDGTVLTASSTFTAGPFDPGPPLPSLTVFKVGNNAATGTVTAADPTNPTVSVINCGTGAACTGSFTTGASVTLTETPGTGSFGGWSANCSPAQVPPAPPPTTCTIVISGNQAVGAIFN